MLLIRVGYRLVRSVRSMLVCVMRAVVIMVRLLRTSLILVRYLRIIMSILSLKLSNRRVM